jgi:hemerythrin
MKYLEWCGLFEIGIEIIDEQHKKLFNIANDFIDIVSREQVDKDVAFQTLNSLTRYAQSHFRVEEDAASKNGFPVEKLENLTDIHEKLIQEIFDLHTRLSKADQLNINEIKQFIDDWLIMHVLVEDRKIKTFIE